MTTIIDYGMGNLGSIQNMIKKIGHVSVITADPKKIMAASKIILPGVGSYDKAMSNLAQLDLIDVIREKAENSTPLLGICLGMQLLAAGSEEGNIPGLNLIPGKVVRLPSQEDYKIPHMGWNVVHFNERCPLFEDFRQFEEARFYFVHSYYFDVEAESDVAGKTSYGRHFTSSVNRGNIYGVQFHPEKSHKFGMLLLKNYIELT